MAMTAWPEPPSRLGFGAREITYRSLRCAFAPTFAVFLAYLPVGV
jgi:hypothetical protein